MKNKIIIGGIRKSLIRISIGVQVVMVVFIIGINNKLLAKTNSYIKPYSLGYSGGYHLEMRGSIREASYMGLGPRKSIENIEITILDKDNNIIDSSLSNKMGICILKLPLHNQYTLKISKKGWVTKIIEVDTRLSEKKLLKYCINFEIDMFEDVAGLDLSILKEPIANVVYNKSNKCFDYNYKYTDEINEKLENLYADYYIIQQENKIAKRKLFLKKSNTKQQDKLMLDSLPTLASDFNTNDTCKNNLFVNRNGTEINNAKLFSDSTRYISKVDKFNKNAFPADLNSSNITFKIQIIALDGYLPANANFFKKCGSVDEYIHDGKYKYTLGKCKSYQEAMRMLLSINIKGYSDAFVVAFFNGKRINVDEALSIQDALK